MLTRRDFRGLHAIWSKRQDSLVPRVRFSGLAAPEPLAQPLAPDRLIETRLAPRPPQLPIKSGGHREVRLLRVEHGKTGFLLARAPEHKGGAGRPKIVHYSVIAHRTVHVRNAPRADDAPVFLDPHYKAGRKPNVRGARVLGAEGAHNAPTTRDRVPAAPGAVGRLGAFRVSVSESEFECRAALGAPVVHRPPEGRRLRAEAR